MLECGVDHRSQRGQADPVADDRRSPPVTGGQPTPCGPRTPSVLPGSVPHSAQYHRRWTMLYTTAPAAGSSLTKS
jgi:hypothetical protein